MLRVRRSQPVVKMTAGTSLAENEGEDFFVLTLIPQKLN